ncbi:MAG: nucleoside kinase [Deltaproteobacteria bacterium]|nr:nucleoside kinase [Deltaproteobacteria bacterium]
MGAISLKIPQTVTVRVEGREYSITRGTRVKSFLRRHLPDLEPQCLGATLWNRLVALEAPIASSCDLVPVTYASKAGARIYRATLTIMLCESAARLFPSARVQVGQALGDGYYFDVSMEPTLTPEDVAALEDEMRAMVERKEALATMRVPVHEAVEAFEAQGYGSQASIARTFREGWVNLVTMGNHVNLWLHPLLPTTKKIRSFLVRPFGDGLVLSFPPFGKPDDRPGELGDQKALFAAYRETRDWNRLVGVETVADLNRSVVNGDIGEVIRVAEALHERKVAAIADEVASRQGCRMVLVAGPSSSGKTTFVKRLRLQLMAIGLRPKALSTDDYYVNREDTPRDEDGEYDYECLEAIDLDLLNEQLAAVMKGEAVKTPRYSFTKGSRTFRKDPFHLEPREILLIEGIHGLNDRLTEAVPDNRKFKIYVSALTQLCIDDHNRIFTSDARLIRRVVRDRRYRGYTAAQTLSRWAKVRAGEMRWIYPFEGRADAMFNSTLVYEAAVLKVFAERFLMEVPESDPTHVEATRLLEFLDLFVPIFSDDVPATSILREFLGGSSFEY